MIDQTRLRTNFSSSTDCGVNEVSKKNGEKKEDQRPPRGIEKTKAERKQKSREQDARRT